MAVQSVKATRKIIRKYVNKWVTPMGLGWWKLDIIYHLTKKDARKFFKPKKGWVVLGRANADWRYNEAWVHFNVPAMANRTDYENEMTVIHELTHILINEMREGNIDHEERVVSGLTKAFQWTREADK